MNAQQVAERRAVYALDDAVAPMAGEAFDLLATAPQGAAKLRGLILALAVRGKLVPQIASEGTAATLLEQIEKQHTWLVARGVAKRGKPLPRVESSEPPFEIPRTWAWVRLGHVTNFGSTDKAGQLTDDTWVLDLEDIEKDTSKLLRRVRFSERHSLSAKNAFQPGDVLYGKLRPYLNKVIVADQAGVCTTEILPFRCFGPHDPRYFQLALQSAYFLNYVNGKSYGMKMPRLGTDDGRAALVPLPPLAEQHRIVARVEELMGLCDELETRGRLQDEQHARLVATLFDALVASASPAELADNWQRIARHFDLLLDRPEAVDALEQTILQLAVRGLLVPQDSADEPAAQILEAVRSARVKAGSHASGKRYAASRSEPRLTIPAGWETVGFLDLCAVGGGATPSKNNPDYWDGDVPWVSPKDMKVAEIGDSQDHVTPKALRETRLPLVPKPSLLIVVRGMILAHSFPVAVTTREVTLNQDMKSLAPAVDGLVSFLALVLKGFTPEILGLVGHSTHGTCKLESERLFGFTFGLPPLGEQHRIVARVDELRDLCADLRQRLQQAQAAQSNLADAMVSRAAA